MARLRPDGRLRLVVAGSGWLLLLLGIVMLLQMAIPLLLQVPLIAIWLADAGPGLRRFARSQASVSAVLLRGDGGCAAVDARGREYPMTMLAGSVLLERLAWLRFRRTDGTAYSELFLRSDRNADAWRRLQVVWRWAAPGRLANDN